VDLSDVDLNVYQSDDVDLHVYQSDDVDLHVYQSVAYEIRMCIRVSRMRSSGRLRILIFEF
jgi:hypothetical protein